MKRFPQFCDARQQPEGGKRVVHRNQQAGTGLAVLELLECLGELRERRRDAGVEIRPDLRQFHAPVHPPEEIGAKRYFKVPDPLAEARLGKVQRPGRRRQLTVPGNQHEGAKLDAVAAQSCISFAYVFHDIDPREPWIFPGK
ncbi:hypothetical protein QW131_16310 [Roseibium salinum]|nr:hypothetical protein [Roseibium salinum]